MPNIVRRLAQQLASGVTDASQISIVDSRRLAGQLSIPECREGTAQAACKEAKRLVREEGRPIEAGAMYPTTVRTPRRRSSTRQQANAALYRGVYEHGSLDRQIGAVPKGCTCRVCVPVRNAEATRRALLVGRISDLIVQTRGDMQMQFTPEILDRTFEVEGRYVRWEDATEAEHRAAAAAGVPGVAGWIENLARHTLSADLIASVATARALKDLGPSALAGKP